MDEIMLALTGLRKTMASKEASLLIYYAGHGYLDKPTETGLLAASGCKEG